MEKYILMMDVVATVSNDNQIIWMTFSLILLLVFVSAYLGFLLFRRQKDAKVLARHVKQLRLLNEISGQFASVLELDGLFEYVVDSAREKFGYPQVAIFIVDGEQDVLLLKASAGWQITSTLEDYSLPMDQGIPGWVVQHNQPLLVNNVDAEPRYENISPQGFEEKTLAECAMPIQLRGGIMGVLDVQSSQRNAFDENDLAILRALARQIAVVIETGRLYEAVQLELLERQQAEEALRESEARYRELVKHAPAGIYEIDFGRGCFVSVNDVMCEYTGYTREEFLAMSPLDILTPESRQRYLDRYAKMLSGVQVPDTVEYSIKEKDGSERWVIINANFVYDADNLVGATVVAHDISARKHAEEQLRVSEHHHRQMIENSPNPIFNVNKSGVIQIWNRTSEEVLLYGSEMIGQPVQKLLYSPQDAERIKTSLEQVFRGISLNNINISFRGRDGAQRYMVSRLYPLFDREGTVKTCVFANTDLTDRIRAEEKVRRLNEKLEQRVKERTAQLEAANTELESFAYSVSHDLRAPLRGIKGFSQALLDDYYQVLDDTGRDHLQRVGAAGERMEDLIESLLQLSRLTQGEMKCCLVGLSELAQEIAAALQESEPERRAKFEITPGLAVDNGDERLLRIVLGNLLGNAWKFTRPRDNVEIIFDSTQVNDQTTYFIRDNGVGFDMLYADKLFGAFQRLHPASQFEGTGIGLATVQRIVHRHGGKIWVESEVDKGTTFYFTL